MIKMFRHELLKLIALSMIPAFEARAAIAYAVLFMNMNNIPLFIVLTAVSATTGIIVYYSLNLFEKWVRRNGSFLRRILRRMYEKYIDYLRNKTSKYVEKYGLLGLTMFIMIPFPGSGVWTGALVANMFNVRPRDTVFAIIIGAYMSSIISWFLSNLGVLAFSYFPIL